MHTTAKMIIAFTEHHSSLYIRDAHTATTVCSWLEIGWGASGCFMQTRKVLNRYTHTVILYSY